MRVLLIHQAFSSGNEPGGTRHFEFGERLARHGDSMTVVASQIHYLTGDRHTAGQKKLFTRERAGSVEILRAYTPAVHHKGFAWRVWAFVVFSVAAVWTGLRAGKTDVVMGTSPSLFQAVAAWAIAAIRRRPFLLEIRDLWPEFAIEMGVLRNPILQRLARWLERFLYRRADHLLVNSPAYVAYLIGRGVPAEAISFVPNGVDPSMFDPDATGESFRAEHDLRDNFIVTYAGAHGPANDLDTVLDAALELIDQPAVRFVFVGDGKDRDRLESMAHQMGLTNTTFIGAVAKNRMREVLAASNACLAILQNIPMFTTTYPNKVFDYMAAGRPTILAIDGVIREVIEKANGGLFVGPGDAKALAAAVEVLAADPKRAAQMGQSARLYVQQHFNRDEQGEAFRNLLCQIIRRN